MNRSRLQDIHMIKYLAQTLTLILQNIPSRDVIDGTVKYGNISLSLLEKVQYAINGDIGEMAIRRQLGNLKQWIDEELLENQGYRRIDRDSLLNDMQQKEPGIDIFALIDCIAGRVLTMHDGKPVYRYRELPAWHQMAGKIGTSLIVAAAYAKEDHIKGKPRKEYMWDTNIEHDNSDLKRIYARGISENHFHLRASSPYFILAWLSLMNFVDVSESTQYMKQMDENLRHAKVAYRRDFQDDCFEVLHLKAALIRVFLYAELTGKKIKVGIFRMDVRRLLRMIGREENIFRSGDKDSPGKTVRTYLEHRCGITGGKGVWDLEKERCVQEKYPLTYWFFWKERIDFSRDVLIDYDELFSEKNISGMADDLDKNHRIIPLEHCWIVFKGRREQEFWVEWDLQLRKNVDALLCSPERLCEQRKTIQAIIDSLQEDVSPECKDYALNADIKWKGKFWEKAVLSGERYLSYRMLYDRGSIQGGKEDDMLYRLFFAYLLMKEAFRMELLQNNEKSGFNNFVQYQNRKDWFTGAFSEGQLAQVAVRGAYARRSLVRLEMRVSPKISCEENVRMIQEYDRSIGKCDFIDGRELDYYYVFHFGKRPDMAQGKQAQLRYRHEAFREKLNQKVAAIIHMREQVPEIGVRLKGIDACSSEDGCRPEVFASAFRRLKNHTFYREDIGEELSQLHISYHVGEENQDVLDGLRAIDEAVFFLNLGTGDRLGHATMLGVNVVDWYYKNDFTVVMRQQDYLDNLAWLYHQIIRFHIANDDNLLEYLADEFQRVFAHFYESGLNAAYNAEIVRREAEKRGKTSDSHRVLQFDIFHYYTAWQLRGDNPRLYRKGFFKWQSSGENFWNQHDINREVDHMDRQDIEAVILYHAYHYVPQIFEEGEKPIRVHIPQPMVRGIAMVQKAMQWKIAGKGIAIETNPSSNVQIAGLSKLSTSVKIGGLSGYHDHPIISFYNKGLTNNEQELAECPQLNVSINTDDPGVFATSLENEYTLMAYALENSRDCQGQQLYKRDMIYDWIDNIRKMGNDQSFQ